MGNKCMKKQEQIITEKIGERLKLRRLKLGLSQQKLAQRLDISFQQLQKYENGLNRISAAKIQMLCGFLSVAPAYFYGENVVDNTLLLSYEKSLIKNYNVLNFEDKRIVEHLMVLMKGR